MMSECIYLNSCDVNITLEQFKRICKGSCDCTYEKFDRGRYPREWDYRINNSLGETKNE